MPALNLGNRPTPLDDTTMVIYRGGAGRKPMFPDRKRDLARRCGINFIRLMWKENLTTTIGVSGFQHVKLSLLPKKGGGKEPVAQWHKNEHTLEPMAEGAMDFVPDEMETGFAYLPDSPFNRVRLAYAEIAKNAQWVIDDDKIKEEIFELVTEIKQSIEYKQEVTDQDRERMDVEMRVKENNVKSGIEHKSRIELEVGVLAEKVKELELNEKRDALKKRLAVLQGNISKDKPVDKKPVVNKKPVGVDSSIRKQAKADVYNKYPELIEEIKTAHKEKTGNARGWGWAPEYKDKVEPLVNKRVEEILEENEHSTVGVGT